MNFTDSQYDSMIEVAKRIGAEDGKYSTHVCDLSGEWADRPTAKDVLESIYAVALQTDDSLDADDFYRLEDVDTDYILDFYESAFDNEYWEYHNEASN
jgi:predicted RNase H-like HicB family nuclease